MTATDILTTEPTTADAQRCAEYLVEAGVEVVMGLAVESRNRWAQAGSPNAAELLVLAAEVVDLRTVYAVSERERGELQHRAVAGMVLCVHCGGEGQWTGETDDGQERIERCGHCDGTGWIDAFAETDALRARVASLEAERDTLLAALEAHAAGVASLTATIERACADVEFAERHAGVDGVLAGLEGDGDCGVEVDGGTP